MKHHIQPFIVLLLSVFFSIVGLSALNAQSSVVKMSPESSRGFLVLDKVNKSITSWRIDICRGNPDSMKTKPDTSFLLYNKNYIAIPSKFYQSGTDNYSYRVTGYNSNGGVVVAQLPQKLCTGCPPPNFEELRTWTCDGKTYAWKVKLWLDHQTYKQYLVFDQAKDFSTQANGGLEIPYYEWGTEAWFGTICGGSINRERYGLADWDCNNVNESNRIITRQNTYPYLRDGQCANLMNGTVFGVQKYLDNWRSAGGMMVDIGTSPNIGITRSEMLSYVNQHNVFGFGPANQLGCSECGTVSGWENGGWELTIMDIDVIWTSGVGPGFDLWHMITGISHLAGGEPQVINDSYNWYSGLLAVNISRVDEPGLKISLEKSKLFDGNGNFNVQPLVFAPGLYKFEFIHKNLAGLPYFLDVQETINNSLKDKDFFETKIYPVPITGGSFNIDMASHVNLDVSYAIYNPNMTLVYKNKYKLAKGYKGTEVINLPALYATGNYTHIFTFADGSTKSFITPIL